MRKGLTIEVYLFYFLSYATSDIEETCNEYFNQGCSTIFIFFNDRNNTFQRKKSTYSYFILVFTKGLKVSFRNKRRIISTTSLSVFAFMTITIPFIESFFRNLKNGIIFLDKKITTGILVYLFSNILSTIIDLYLPVYLRKSPLIHRFTKEYIPFISLEYLLCYSLI